MIYYISKQITKDVISNKDITITGLEKVKEDLKNEKEIVLDCETNGLHPVYNQILVLQFGTKQGNQYVIDVRNYNIQDLREILENPNITFIGHNIKFDYNMLKQYGIILTKIYDTMLTDMVIYNDAYPAAFIKKEHRFSLSGMYKHYYGSWINKSPRAEIQHIGLNPLTYIMIKYAALDVYYPWLIKEKQTELITKYNLIECVNLENKVALSLGDIEYNGFKIDSQKWLDVVERYAQRVTETEKQLDELLLQQLQASKFKVIATQLTLFGEPSTKKTIVNWKSDQQVLAILHNIFHLYPIDKDGKPSSGADAIEFLSTKNDFTELLLKYREETKVVDSFGKKYIENNVDKDGRIRTSYHQIVSTGRVSSRNPNLQQVKGFDKNDLDSEYFRKAFCVDDNYKLSTADYSQQEARIMADFANDESYINFFNKNGSDIHSFVASKMFSAKFKKEFKVSKTENEEYRQKGKTLNFAVSFGTSAYTLSKRLKISKDEAQELIDSFYEGFPSLKQFFNNCKNFGIKYGYIRTNNIINRIRHFPEWPTFIKLKDSRSLDATDRKTYAKIKGSIERKSVNSIIQGSAGDMTKIALINIRNELLNAGIKPLSDAPVKIVNVVHDEITIEALNELIEYWSIIQRECMEKAGSVICKKLKILVDIKIANHWAH